MNAALTTGFEIDAEQAAWNSGAKGLIKAIRSLQQSYHVTPPFDVLCDLRAEICLLLEERNIPVKYHHHEVAGPGQMEIEVEFGTMSEMADKTMLVKYLIKNAAFAAGKTATFMPKPLWGEAGSGLHVHMHLFKNGEPLFMMKTSYSALSDTALYFIGGLLQQHRPPGFTNPSTNSYKRLVPGYEAPVSICLPPPTAVLSSEFPPMHGLLMKNDSSFVLLTLRATRIWPIPPC